eukprot:2352238-Prymnesium_polylepis.1
MCVRFGCDCIAFYNTNSTRPSRNLFRRGELPLGRRTQRRPISDVRKRERALGCGATALCVARATRVIEVIKAARKHELLLANCGAQRPRGRSVCRLQMPREPRRAEDAQPQAFGDVGHAEAADASHFVILLEELPQRRPPLCRLRVPSLLRRHREGSALAPAEGGKGIVRVLPPLRAGWARLAGRVQHPKASSIQHVPTPTRRARAVGITAAGRALTDAGARVLAQEGAHHKGCEAHVGARVVDRAVRADPRRVAPVLAQRHQRPFAAKAGVTARWPRAVHGLRDPTKEDRGLHFPCTFGRLARPQVVEPVYFASVGVQEGGDGPERVPTLRKVVRDRVRLSARCIRQAEARRVRWMRHPGPDSCHRLLARFGGSALIVHRELRAPAEKPGDTDIVIATHEPAVREEVAEPVDVVAAAGRHDDVECVGGHGKKRCCAHARTPSTATRRCCAHRVHVYVAGNYQHAERHGAPSGQAGTYPLASDV